MSDRRLTLAEAMVVRESQEVIEHLRGRALEALRRLRDVDEVRAHMCGDRILVDLLTALGFRDVAEAWEDLGKWYE